MKMAFAVGAFAVLLVLGAATASAEYRLGPSDGVRIKVRDWPDLGGEYTVNAEGRVSLPIIGEVEATGLTAGGLSTAITNRLKRDNTQPDGMVASVEIIRFRPVYIMGDVQRAGELAFRPGLTVLQAVSMAGGYYRAADPSLIRTDREIATSQGDIDSETLRLEARKARLARLEASLDGKADIAFPPELLERGKDPSIAALLANERRILEVERQDQKDEEQSLERIRELYSEEIASLAAQNEALEREEESLQKQLAALRKLAGQGLALAPNVITLERTLAQNQNERLNIATATVRARQAIELAEQRMRDKLAERQTEQAAQLQEAKTDAANSLSRIGTGQVLVQEALNTARLQGSNVPTDIMQRRDVIVVRKEGDVLKEMPAQDGMILQPDDVVKVMPLPVQRLTVTTGALRP